MATFVTNWRKMFVNGNDQEETLPKFISSPRTPGNHSLKISRIANGLQIIFPVRYFVLSKLSKTMVKLNGVMLEKSSAWKTESEIMKEAIFLEYDGGGIQTFLTRADKSYSQEKFSEQAKFGLLRDSLESDRTLLQFVLFRGEKSKNQIKQACVEYADNRKMMEGAVKNKERKGIRFRVQSNPKDYRIHDLCKQVENFHLMVIKKPRSARESEPVCYKCINKGHYAWQCRSRQESTSYCCNKKGHHARECQVKSDPLVSCTYFHHKGQRFEDCFVRRSNEAVDKQDLRIFRTNSADDSSNNHLRKADIVMFVEQEYDETVAAFKLSATGKKLTEQQRMQNDIAECRKPIIRTDPRTNFEPDLPAPRKPGRGAKKPRES